MPGDIHPLPVVIDQDLPTVNRCERESTCLQSVPQAPLFVQYASRGAPLTGFQLRSQHGQTPLVFALIRPEDSDLTDPVDRAGIQLERDVCNPIIHSYFKLYGAVVVAVTAQLILEACLILLHPPA